MDLGAFSQIEDLQKVMADNHIFVPRLRGLRLMKNETPLTTEKIDEVANRIGLLNCQDACCSRFLFEPNYIELSSETRAVEKKYLIKDKDDYKILGIRWDKVHGYKRKIFKYRIRKAKERTYKQYSIFNKYCGRDDVLYIHARIGGQNWENYDGPELAKQPWFLEKVDDAFDETYCDIYAKIMLS